MKYKVSDKVKIRTWSDMEQEFGLDQDGDIRTHWSLVKLMKDYCDKIVTIKEVSDHYEMRECRWNWSDEMIDHVATRIMSIIDRLEMLKELVSPNFEMIIDRHIDILKSDKPRFNVRDINFYNNVFRKFKGKSK